MVAPVAAGFVVAEQPPRRQVQRLFVEAAALGWMPYSVSLSQLGSWTKTAAMAAAGSPSTWQENRKKLS